MTATLLAGLNVQSLSVKTDWGWEGAADYDPAAGQPRRVEIKSGGVTASAEFDRGRPVRVRRFDGGEFVITYPPQPGSPPECIRTPNGLALNYRYGSNGPRAGAAVAGFAVLAPELQSGEWVRLGYVEYGGIRQECEFDAQNRLIGLRYQAAEP